MSGIIGVSPSMKSGVIGKVFGFQSMQVFTASGTWTKPTGITTIRVIVTGSGGGGGAGAADDNMGASGGAGGTAISVIDVTSNASETVTIGVVGGGGASGNSGGGGGSSSFGSLVVATGGGGGNMSGTADYNMNAGGVGTTGQFLLHGGAGCTQGTGDAQAKGPTPNGGSSYWGGGGRSCNSRHNDIALAGKAFGSGGGAGHHYSGGASRPNVIQGNDGCAGVVVVEEYCN